MPYRRMSTAISTKCGKHGYRGDHRHSPHPQRDQYGIVWGNVASQREVRVSAGTPKQGTRGRGADTLKITGQNAIMAAANPLSAHADGTQIGLLHSPDLAAPAALGRRRRPAIPNTAGNEVYDLGNLQR